MTDAPAHASAIGIVPLAPPATRPPVPVRRPATDVFVLALGLVPGTSASQDDRTARLEPGDFAIVDGTRPFSLGFRRDVEQLALTLPRDLLLPLLADPRGSTAVRVRGDRGLGAVASGALVGFVSDAGPADPHGARALADHLAGLVALALADVRPTVPTRTTTSGLLRAALDELERSLGDPALSPALVADRIGVSTRYLHRLFSDDGPSFGRRLLARRLELGRRDLTDPVRAHWTVAAIAADRGFRDPSYFARAFRARYGATPHAVRRRSIVGPHAGAGSAVHAELPAPRRVLAELAPR